jgi:hypothetical protein
MMKKSLTTSNRKTAEVDVVVPILDFLDIYATTFPCIAQGFICLVILDFPPVIPPDVDSRKLYPRDGVALHAELLPAYKVIAVKPGLLC